MSCKQWKDAWIAALYAELEPPEERELRAHLETCAACRATLESLSATRERVQAGAPAVPASPRLVLLGAAPRRFHAFSFAAGLACAVVVFALGALSTGPATQQAAQTARQERLAESELAGFEDRLSRLETRPVSASVTPAELAEAFTRFERRFNEERVRDLEYFTRTLTASEVRTGAWLDQTTEALAMLARRQEPGFGSR